MVVSPVLTGGRGNLFLMFCAIEHQLFCFVLFLRFVFMNNPHPPPPPLLVSLCVCVRASVCGVYVFLWFNVYSLTVVLDR